MRWTLGSDSRVLVDLRATGLLRAVAHDPTLIAVPEPASLEVADGEPVDVPITAIFRSDRIVLPTDLDPSERERMRDNLRGGDVLDSARFPTLTWQGRYMGTIEAGRLDGDLSVRGVAHPVRLDVRVTPRGGGRLAQGSWEGRLSALGIKPFRALMGALRLQDWIRLRLEVSFDQSIPAR